MEHIIIHHVTPYLSSKNYIALSKVCKYIHNHIDLFMVMHQENPMLTYELMEKYNKFHFLTEYEKSIDFFNIYIIELVIRNNLYESLNRYMTNNRIASRLLFPSAKYGNNKIIMLCYNTFPEIFETYDNFNGRDNYFHGARTVFRYKQPSVFNVLHECTIVTYNYINDLYTIAALYGQTDTIKLLRLNFNFPPPNKVLDIAAEGGNLETFLLLRSLFPNFEITQFAYIQATLCGHFDILEQLKQIQKLKE